MHAACLTILPNALDANTIGEDGLSTLSFVCLTSSVGCRVSGESSTFPVGLQDAYSHFNGRPHLIM